MTDRITTLMKLADSSRNRKNMEKVQTELGNLQELRDSLEPWLEAAEEISSHIDTFAERTSEIDADYLPAGVHDKLEALIVELKKFLPEEGSELALLPEQFDTATEGIGELEGMLDDRDYGAEDRDEKWYEATEAFGQVVVGLDLLSCLGTDLEAESEEEKDS
jgi:hypothetical protein